GWPSTTTSAPTQRSRSNGVASRQSTTGPSWCFALSAPPIRRHSMVQRFLYAIDEFSTWVGKLVSWLIIGLMVVVCVEVFKRYFLNAPTAWIFDAENMLYGSFFMLAGAYTLAQNAHVRGDFLYSSMRPRMQATLDFVLYLVFFVPGIAA